MKTKEVMTTGVEYIRENNTVADAMNKMLKLHITSLVVEKEGEYDAYGIVTRKDIINKVIAEKKNPKKTKVKDIMSKPVLTVHPELSTTDVAKLMAKTDLRRFPVHDGKKIVGMISNSDILRAETLERL